MATGHYLNQCWLIIGRSSDNYIIKSHQLIKSAWKVIILNFIKTSQVIACCLMATGHYLNQCWLIIGRSSDNYIIKSHQLIKSAWKVIILNFIKTSQVIACCLMATGHYLNQCWLIIGRSSDNYIIKSHQLIKSAWKVIILNFIKTSQVIACCLMATGHYLNQCWLIIGRSSDNYIIKSHQLIKSAWKVIILNFIKTSQEPIS